MWLWEEGCEGPWSSFLGLGDLEALDLGLCADNAGVLIN